MTRAPIIFAIKPIHFAILEFCVYPGYIILLLLSVVMILAVIYVASSPMHTCVVVVARVYMVAALFV